MSTAEHRALPPRSARLLARPMTTALAASWLFSCRRTRAPLCPAMCSLPTTEQPQHVASSPPRDLRLLFELYL